VVGVIDDGRGRTTGNWWWDETAEYLEDLARARYEAEHATTALCIHGCCELYIFNGREIGSVGPAGCPHAEESRRLHRAYRARSLARKRRRCS
jgi:hypothetical protein